MARRFSVLTRRYVRGADRPKRAEPATEKEHVARMREELEGADKPAPAESPKAAQVLDIEVIERDREGFIKRVLIVAKPARRGENEEAGDDGAARH